MTEREYFAHLEMRVCRELNGLRQKELHGFWCDGFIPEEFSVVGVRCRMSGFVWIDNGSGKQERWELMLLLDNKTLVREEIDWAQFLPAEDVTGWLSMDFQTRFMKICQLAAHPDHEPGAT